MKKQIWRDGMPRRFDQGWKWPIRPGALDHLRSDVGIVYHEVRAGGDCDYLRRDPEGGLVAG